MARIRALTDQQKLFCKFYIESDKIQESAIKAGYAESSAHVTASKLLKNAKIIEYIGFLKCTVEEIFQEEVKNNLAVLKEIRDDRTAPSASRVKSAQDLLDRAGYGATKKIEGNINTNVTGSLTTSKEVHIIQEVINSNEDVAEALLDAIRKRNAVVAPQEETKE